MCTPNVAKVPNCHYQGWLNDALRYAESHKEISISRGLAYRLLQECGKLRDLELSRRLHLLLLQNGLDSVSFLADHFIRLFSSCQSLVESSQTFDKVLKPSQYTWNAIIDAYTKLGRVDVAFNLFDVMQQTSRPDMFLFSSILKACINAGSLEHGRYIHEQIFGFGLQSNIVVGNVLLDTYIKCWSLEEAFIIFDTLPSRDLVTWGSMIAGFSQYGEGHLALQCLRNMQEEGLKPDQVILCSVLRVCSSLDAIGHGRCIHEQMIDGDYKLDTIAGNTLVDMYAKLGNLEEAQQVFNMMPNRNVVTWGALISGYVQHAKGSLAVEHYKSMQLEGIKPNKIIFSSIFKACGSIAAIEQGRQIHEQIIGNGLPHDTVVGNTLVDMYAKCGNLEEALRVFDGLCNQDILAWGTMIAGYTQHGESVLSLKCYENMQCKGMRPDKVIFSSILKACGTIGAIEYGRMIHHACAQGGFQSDAILLGSILEMYTKCGNMLDASNLFRRMSNYDEVLWGVMITGYAQLGDPGMAVQYYHDMQNSGVQPRHMVFSGILSAFGRAGLVAEGLWYFNAMRYFHAVEPDVFHFTCMIDILGRAACFKEAENLLREAGMLLDICLWLTLLGACRMHENMELANLCFKELLYLDFDCSAAYVLMSNMHATAGFQRKNLAP